ncbi:DUF2920 family protein [Campylobacter peloridis]|uniref:DUF2920 family protein n=1 Tax=Campylobacter peloridis TaxID=488546 RepID=UPI0028FCBDE5|nr:DUF2920 family protein [Campylobacter peloridis]
MLVNETYFIDSCDDVELGIKRENKLEYRITYDNAKSMQAIVFMIGGYGANANIEMIDFHRQFIAKKFNVVAVSVFYHCFNCRKNKKDKQYSACFLYDEKDIEYFKKALSETNIIENWGGGLILITLKIILHHLNLSLTYIKKKIF